MGTGLQVVRDDRSELERACDRKLVTFDRRKNTESPITIAKKVFQHNLQCLFNFTVLADSGQDLQHQNDELCRVDLQAGELKDRSELILELRGLLNLRDYFQQYVRQKVPL